MQGTAVAHRIALPQTAGRLEMTVVAAGDCVTAFLCGEIDAATAEAFGEMMKHLERYRFVVLDLRHVGYMSVAGARILHKTTNRLQQRRGRLESRNPHSIVRRMLELFAAAEQHLLLA